MATITMTELTMAAGMNEAWAKARAGNDAETRYLQYRKGDGKWIDVEFTAPQFLDAVTSMATSDQTLLFLSIAHLLSQEGDSLEVVDGDRKKRSARVVRLSSEFENVIKLLVAR